MLDVADLQRAAGHDVAFFAMAHDENDPSPYAARFPARLELEPPPAGVVGKARAAGRMLYSTSARRGIEVVVDDFAPDVVHLHNIYHHLSPSILRPLAERGIPTVMTLHDYKLVCPTYRLLDGNALCDACVGHGVHHAVTRRCNRGSLVGSALVAFESFTHRAMRAYDPVDVFVSPSEFLTQKIRRDGRYADRLRTIPHFVDLDAIAPATAPPDATVVYAGRLSDEKGVDVLIDAMARLDGCSLVIAGDGPARGDLEARAVAVAGDRITFTGRIDRAAVHDLLRRASAVVVPSRWHENQPIVVLEARGCAAPVVATSLGGLPELVRPGVDGALADPDDAVALARALRPFVDDGAYARAAGVCGREDAVCRFSTAAHLAALDLAYQDASLRKRQAA